MYHFHERKQLCVPFIVNGCEENKLENRFENLKECVTTHGAKNSGKLAGETFLTSCKSVLKLSTF
jgi:Kunitz/Bovine pancreatic trypsin inhibitor domain